MNLLQLGSLLQGTILKKKKLDAAYSFYKCLILYLRPTLHSKTHAQDRARETGNMFTIKVAPSKISSMKICKDFAMIVLVQTVDFKIGNTYTCSKVPLWLSD